jgi:quinol monooxygenase YgiN
MSVTTVPRFHAADGCQSFAILRDQADPRATAFVQRWSSREAHDAAFGELILASGHLEKVLAVLDEGVVQTFYDVVP